MKSKLVLFLLLFFLAASLDSWADVHLPIRNLNAVRLFRLTLNDYDIKSSNDIKKELEEDQQDLLVNQELQALLLNGDQEILMITNEEKIETAVENLDGNPQVLELPLNFYTLTELIRNQFTFGTYETEGYVVSVDQCECPLGSRCEPCVEKHIIVSEFNKEPRDYVFSSEDLIFFTPESGKFELGTKYKFIIQILDAKSTAQKLNNIKLIYYEKIT